jgi:D-3-phosphoglycerate dehydrogenase
MKVLVTDAEYPDLSLERAILEEAGFEVVEGGCRTPGEVVDRGRGAVALLVQYAHITREVFEALPALRIVSRYGAGVDTVDLVAAREHGVWVANVPDSGVTEVAAHAAAMALSLLRHLPAYDRAVREGRWHYLATGPLRRCGNLTLGVVGLGRIGRTVAERLGPWFQRVLGFDPYLPDQAWPAGAERLSLEGLFAASHLVTLHLPLTSETRGVVGRALLSTMPRGSFLVNTARGGLVDMEALLWALDAGVLEAAGLDVLPAEPPPSDHPILSHPRVLLSPHAAFYSVDAEEELRRKAASSIVSWGRTGRPIYSVVEGADG